MLDIARAVALLYALVKAVRHRFALGVIFGALAALGMALIASEAYVALSRHDVNGEYGFAFVYVGPTMLPLGGRDWLPTVMQLALAAITAVPTIAALRTPSSPVTNPFLVVFLPNAVLAVLASLGAFLMWHQRSMFPEYWENPSLAEEAAERRYAPITLRPGRDEGVLASPRSYTPVDLLVRNHASHDIHLVWIDFDGHRDSRPSSGRSAAPGLVIKESSWAGHAFVITDDDGKAMCTLVLGARDAVAEVDGPCP
jgi:hypothetical protein